MAAASTLLLGMHRALGSPPPARQRGGAGGGGGGGGGGGLVLGACLSSKQRQTPHPARFARHPPRRSLRSRGEGRSERLDLCIHWCECAGWTQMAQYASLLRPTGCFALFEHDFDQAFHCVPSHLPRFLQRLAVRHETGQRRARDGKAPSGSGAKTNV